MRVKEITRNTWRIMGKPSRDKGLRVVREIVNACLSSGIKTESVRRDPCRAMLIISSVSVGYSLTADSRFINICLFSLGFYVRSMEIFVGGEKSWKTS